MTRAWLVILCGAIAAMSCNDPDVVPPTQLNLDRPVDISFACYGPVRDAGTGAVGQSAQPPRWCNAYSPVLTADTPAVPPPGLEDVQQLVFTWYGFILQPASGTVALASWLAKPSDTFSSGLSTNPASDVQVLDADTQTPGRNPISVGENPIAIGTDVAGCHEVTANAGSCDLSVLDINSAVEFSQGKANQAVVDRLNVLNGSMQPIRARPSAMVMQPSASDAAIGAVCAPGAASGTAYIAYPGCHLVAGVDLSTGVIQQGIQFTGTVPKVLTAADIAGLTCMDECNGAVAPTGPGALRPSTLDLRVDVPGKPTRLAIGADNSSTITVVDLDAGFLPVAAPLQIQLEDRTADHTLGIKDVALTPQIAMGNSTVEPRSNSNFVVGEGAPVGGEGQYVYAVASDGTVRVVDVLNVRKECDTQIDLRYVREIAANAANLPKLQCFPVGDPTNPPRRAGARGPGIELPIDGAPTSVAIIEGLNKPLTVDAPVVDGNGNPVNNPDGTPMTAPKPGDPAPNMLIGYFAVVSASSGQSYLVNIDDDDAPDVFDPANPQATQPVLILAHQLRDSFTLRGAGPVANNTVNACTAIDPPSASTGGPRTTGDPVRIAGESTVSVDPSLPVKKSFGLPDLLREVCTGTTTGDTPATATTTVPEVRLGASAALRDQVYPDLRSVTSETWTLTWEGTLSTDSVLAHVDGPPVRTAQMVVDGNGMRLVDNSKPFCDVGVEPFDIVQFHGCNPVNGDNECPSGYTCFAHEDNQVTGLGACMLKSEAPRLSVACHDFLTTARRYTVAQAASGELTLYPRKHVLATTPVDGCVSHKQCQDLAGYELGLRSARQPFQLTGANLPVDSHAWQCQLDPLRAPVDGNATAKRCIEACATTTDCDAGTVCVGASAGGTVKDGTCMESVLPPQSCVNGPQRFDLRASEAFTVVGSRTGYVHQVVEQNGQCVVARTPGSVDVARIPLDAPACAAPGDLKNPATGELTRGGFEANPCSTTVTQAENQPNYDDPAACTVADANNPTVPAVRATPAPAIKVRTRAMTLTLVDPYSPGDLVCVGDRQGALGKIPQLVPPTFDAATPFADPYQLKFDQKAGYTPLPLAPGFVAPAFPVRIVFGPGKSIWVMDDGDVLATAIGQSSTKGQVFRVEMLNLTTTNQLQ